MLTDAEIIELEQLLIEREIDILKEGLLWPVVGKQNANYVFIKKAIEDQRYDLAGKLISGYRGVILEGSSRSGKTWSGVDIIIWLCTEVETSCNINIYRETYAEFKETLYDDFKKRLDQFGLPNPFHNAQEVKSFKIGKNRITFLGCDKIGKTHGAGCDYAFFNEMIHIPNNTFDQVEMRCRKFWWGDYNPSVTEHWIFNKVITRDDVGYLQTTFKDNPHISYQEKNKILSYEPWEPGSYEIRDNTEVWYNGAQISDKNQPPPHTINITQGTADAYMWTVYGLGLRGAMAGIIFRVTWISPEDKPVWNPIHTLDFGFTNDPTAGNNYWEDEHNIWIEPLIYKPIDNSEELSAACEAVGMMRGLPMICDSADKYTAEGKGSVRMVMDLKRLRWSAKKVSKTKGVTYHITSMKRKKIHIVKNHLYPEIKKEQENYKWKEVNGIYLNIPIDEFNHFWDSARYGHMAYNTKVEITTEWS